MLDGVFAKKFTRKRDAIQCDAAGKMAYANIKSWTMAVPKARKELRVNVFVAVKKGSPIYKAAKAHYTA